MGETYEVTCYDDTGTVHMGCREEHASDDAARADGDEVLAMNARYAPAHVNLFVAVSCGARFVGAKHRGAKAWTAEVPECLRWLFPTEARA